MLSGKGVTDRARTHHSSGVTEAFKIAACLGNSAAAGGHTDPARTRDQVTDVVDLHERLTAVSVVGRLAGFEDNSGTGDQNLHVKRCQLDSRQSHGQGLLRILFLRSM